MTNAPPQIAPLRRQGLRVFALSITEIEQPPTQWSAAVQSVSEFVFLLGKTRGLAYL